MIQNSNIAVATTATQVTSLPRGSEWRKWDLRIQGPKSALNNQFPHLPDGEPDWEQYACKLESLTDVAVLDITDYFSIEGCRKIFEFRRQGRLQNIAQVLPNIELRLDKIIGKNKGPRRLNYQVIFCEVVSPDEINEHFLYELKFDCESDLQCPVFNLSVRRLDLDRMDAQLKGQHEPFRNPADQAFGFANGDTHCPE